jgi:hypothetical protein
MVTHDDYTFSDKGDHDQWVVRLKTGKYADTYYMYGRVQIKVPEGADLEEDDINATLSFQYNVIESPLGVDALMEDEDFNNYIGEVLSHIIEDSFDTGNYKIGNKDGESGNDNTKESD